MVHCNCSVKCAHERVSLVAFDILNPEFQADGVAHTVDVASSAGRDRLNVIFNGTSQMGPSDMSLEIQVAFQGGGARFLAMLPVAEAFHAAHDAGIVKIVAVAGTSAGSLCAALVAADCDFAALRHDLLRQGDDFIARATEGRAKQIKGILSSGSITAGVFKAAAAPIAVGEVLSGTPVLDETAFNDFIDMLLQHCRSPEKARIDKLAKARQMALTIVRTNLETGLGERCVDGSLKHTLADSCAFPLAFRSFASQSHSRRYVDGGLCDNLPVKCLRENPAAPIFAVYPREDEVRNDIDGLFPYALALMSAGISNSVSHSLAVVEEGFRMPVDVRFSTFDFVEAMALLRNDRWYSETRAQALRKLKDFARSYGHITSSRQVRFTDARFIEDYEGVLARITADYNEYSEHFSGQMIVRVNCGAKKPNDDERDADTVTRRAKLKITSPKFMYYRSSVAVGASGAVPTIWRAYKEGAGGRELPIRVLSIGALGGKNKACVIEFVDPKANISVGDVLVVETTAYRKGAMRRLNFGQAEFLRFENPHSYKLSTAEVVLRYPASLGRLSLQLNDVESRGFARSERIAFEPNELDVIELGMRVHDLEPQGVLYCDVMPRAGR